MTAEAAHESVPVTDPVCGMTVDPATVFEYGGTGMGAALFCSKGCATALAAGPGQPAAASASAPGAAVP